MSSAAFREAPDEAAVVRAPVFPQVSIVIVTFQAVPALDRCLTALVRDLAELEWEAVVVDNAQGMAAETVAQARGDVTFRPNSRNVGFARAVNQGVARARAPYVLFLNPDCELQPGAVRALRDVLERDASIGIVGPRLLSPDGAIEGSARRDPTILTGLFGRSTRLTRMFPNAWPVRCDVVVDAAIAAGQPSVPVDWVSGACMMIRRETFDAVAGFDERFFLYWEDADFCRRARRAGYSVHYVPNAVGVHVAGQSSRTVPLLATREFHRSAYRYYCKHVARSASHPGRLIARVVLALRCWWMIWKMQTASADGAVRGLETRE